MKLTLAGFTLAVSLVALLQTGNVFSQDQDKYLIEVGKHHADFELPSINGKELIKLSDFKGRKLLLFHFASW